jgi:ABC-type transport system involved in cytochrome bd biosynthesis fused ATPase/permease subunit
MLIIKANNKNLRKHILNRHNSEITLSDSVNEIIWGYKDIKINNLKEIALSNYRLTLSNFKNSLTNIQYSGIWPKNIIEGIFLVGIATIVYMINTNNLNLSILEVTSSLVVILKFIPTTNAIYLNSHTLNAHESALEDIFESNRRSRTDLNNTQTLSSENINKQTLKNSISIKINEFYYDKANYILNLSPFEKTFSKGEINFIIGASGSGKSTLLDILGGLYPEPGIKICEQDNEDILINKSEYVHEYISNLAYAPQKFYPFENSLIYNITLTHESLDTMTKKEKNNLLNAMDIANLPLDFLDKQYNLSISTLSGGQLQRVGLARAIYRNKYILLLDEVTSALDFTTKMHVLKKLSTLAKSTIIICVTHDKQIIQNFKSKSVTELI